MFVNETGQSNVANGYRALFDNQTGNYNTAIGRQSLFLNEQGNNNTALGYSAGSNLTAGNNNIIIGGNTISFPLATGSNQLNIGNIIYGTDISGTNNTISPGKIGIGVKSPVEKLEVAGAVKLGTTTGTNAGAIRWTGTDFEGYNGSAWKSFTTSPADTSPAWYNEGTTTNANNTTSDIIRSGNVGLGVTTANHSLDIKDDRGETAINIAMDDNNFSGGSLDSHGIKMVLDMDNNTISATGKTYAIENTIEVLTNEGYGIKNNVMSHSGNAPTVFGSYQNIYSDANGGTTGYGTYNKISSNVFGYGSYNLIQGSGYGVYSSATSPGAYAGLFLGTLAVGTTTTNTYSFPSSRGSNGQVMQTDGSGNVSWVTTVDNDSSPAWYNEATTTNASNTTSNIIRSGNIGIGVQNPQEKLHVAGGIRLDNVASNWWTTYVDGVDDYNFVYNGALKSYILDTDGSYVVVSDRKLKNNIEEMKSEIVSKVLGLNPVNYTYKNDSTNRLQNGFIAQEVQELFPELVNEKINDEGESFLTLRYDAFGVLAIKTIQEQQKEINALKKEVSAMKEIEERLRRIEERLK